jgi:hypothetical protein
MSATASDLAALRAAIDAGDDSALLPLADALEEMSDPRAAGLRTNHRPLQCDGHVRWEGTGLTVLGDYDGPYLPRALIDAMGAGTLCPDGASAADPAAWWHWREFSSRSAAFLALAEALTDDD